MSEKINQVEPNISENDIQRVNDYMSSGAWITEHALTKELEEKIADFVGRKYAVAVPNGTIAIYLSLLAAGLTEGKRVAVPNITMVATINAIIWAGAEPVIIDLNERLCMSLKSLQTVEKLDGVIYVPLNGRTEDGIAIENYCNEKNITLIEDSAHALGSQYQDKMCGSLGSISVFSFTPHKIITMGQGGLVLTDDDSLYEYLLDLKTFNRSKDRSDWHDGFGLNFKITDFLESESSANKKETWAKLDKTQKIKHLYNYTEILKEKDELSHEEVDKLQKYLTRCLDRKCLMKTKEVIYDKENNKITNIPFLFFNIEERSYLLKKDDKHVSTIKSLPTDKRGKVKTIKIHE